MKTSELIGPALDWAVAKALGHKLKIRNWHDLTDRLDPVEDAAIIEFHKTNNTIRVSAEQIPGSGWFPNETYSTDWSEGGPIIEREKITVAPTDGKSFIGQAPWSAYRIATLFEEGFDHEHQHGPTPLIAAMRCYVASKLGDEIEIPDELKT